AQNTSVTQRSEWYASLLHIETDVQIFVFFSLLGLTHVYLFFYPGEITARPIAHADDGDSQDDQDQLVGGEPPSHGPFLPLWLSDAISCSIGDTVSGPSLHPREYGHKPGAASTGSIRRSKRSLRWRLDSHGCSRGPAEDIRAQYDHPQSPARHRAGGSGRRGIAGPRLAAARPAARATQPAR